MIMMSALYLIKMLSRIFILLSCSLKQRSVGRHVTPLISEALRWQNTTSKMANPRIRPLFQCTRGIKGVAFDERPYQRGYCTVVKPVYKGHSREPENVPFMYRLNLYALFINGKHETFRYLYIEVPFNGGLIVLTILTGERLRTHSWNRGQSEYRNCFIDSRIKFSCTTENPSDGLPLTSL